MLSRLRGNPLSRLSPPPGSLAMGLRDLPVIAWHTRVVSDGERLPFAMDRGLVLAAGVGGSSSPSRRDDRAPTLRRSDASISFHQDR